MTFQNQTQLVCIYALGIALLTYLQFKFSLLYPAGMVIGLVAVSMAYPGLGNAIATSINYPDNGFAILLGFGVLAASIYLVGLIPSLWYLFFPLFIVSFSILAQDFGTWAGQTLGNILMLVLGISIWFGVPTVVGDMSGTNEASTATVVK